MYRMPIVLPTLCFFLAGAGSLRADESVEKVVLATCKLANDGSTASGLVVARPAGQPGPSLYVVTAGHVFAQMKGEQCVLVARRRNDDGSFARCDITIPIRRSGEPLWRKHVREDVALLALPDEVQVDSVPAESLAGEEALGGVHVGDDVRLAVFPERMEANDLGFPIVRGGTVAGYPITAGDSRPTLLIDTTTWTGDSGGPIVHAQLRAPGGEPLVIGFVRGMRSIVDSQKESRFVSRTTQYPLGIAEAVRASAARELIDEAADEP